MSIRLARGLTLLGACALWAAACSKSSNNADTTTVKDTTAAAATAAPPPAPALTDTNIFALLDEANAADSADGNLAATKGTSASVKAFGRDMERDHHMLRKSGQDLAKKLNITPQPPSGDTLQSSAQKMHDSLTAQAKGPAWDQAYINAQVAIHQSVLSMLQNFQTTAQDTSLKAAIGKAIPVVQKHLTNAQNIQTKLSGSAAAGTDSTKK